MKTHHGAVFFNIFLAVPAFSQGIEDIMPLTPNHPSAFTSSPLPDPSEWANTPTDWSESILQFPQWTTNNQTGEVTSLICQVIGVGNGLNYIDSNGAWQQSEDLIEVTPGGGAAALRLPNKAFFGPTLSPTNGIKLVTMSNLVFSTAPVGVYFYDPTSGKEQLLASLQNGVAGKLLPPNRVIYPGAFQSAVLQADLR